MRTFRDAFAERPLIAILRGIEPHEAAAMAEAIVDTGVVVLEVPLNSPRPLESIAAMAETVGERAAVGAGTVYDLRSLAQVRGAGGCFMVSPNCVPELIRAAVAMGMGACPGAMTPTEIMAAVEAGADAVKVFPAEVVQPAGVAALRTVVPADVPLVPVGGVNPDNVATYRAAGADGLGFNSALYKPGRPVEEVRDRAAALVEAWAAAGSASSA